MTAQQKHEVDVLVANGWTYRSAIKYVLVGTPAGHMLMYSKPVMASLVKAIKSYERQHGIRAK